MTTKAYATQCLNLYKFVPKEDKASPLHETDSESSEEESTATASMPTVITATGNDVDTSAEESFEETPAVAAVETVVQTQSDMAACIYCSGLYRKGGVKRHQNYCKQKPRTQ